MSADTFLAQINSAVSVEELKPALRDLVAGLDRRGSSSGWGVTDKIPGSYGRAMQAQLFGGHSTQPTNTLVCVGAVAEFPFRPQLVRLGYVHLGGAGGATGIKAVVAGTDDIGDKTFANTAAARKWCTPWRAGVEKNTLASDGWQAVTWNGGAATVDVADTGSADSVNVAWSDYIPISTYEDSRTPGWYPIIFRAYMGTGAITYHYASGFTAAGTWAADVVVPFYSCRYTSGGDCVTTLSGWTNATGVSILDTNIASFIVEAVGNHTDHKSVMVCGDSRFASSTPLSATSNYRGMAYYMQKSAVASGKKIQICNISTGGFTSTLYQAQGLKLLTSGMTPDVLLHLLWSVNDAATPTADLVELAKGRALRMANHVRSYGGRCIICTAYPQVGGYTAASYALLRGLESWCDSLGLEWVSPLALYGTSTGEWLPGYNHAAGNHMTEKGDAALGAQIAAML